MNVCVVFILYFKGEPRTAKHPGIISLVGDYLKENTSLWCSVCVCVAIRRAWSVCSFGDTLKWRMYQHRKAKHVSVRALRGELIDGERRAGVWEDMAMEETSLIYELVTYWKGERSNPPKRSPLILEPWGLTYWWWKSYWSVWRHPTGNTVTYSCSLVQLEDVEEDLLLVTIN